jgi:hypothetical protein
MNHFTPAKRPVLFSFGWPWFRWLSAGLVVCVVVVALCTVDIPQLLRSVLNLLNYAFGLTRVKWLPYVIATWIGMMPSTIMYVYLGTLARAGVDLTGRTVAEWVFYGFGLVATLIAVILITAMAHRALADRGHNGLRSQLET